MQNELADLEIQSHLILALHDEVDNFVANQLEHPLHHVGTAVAHISNGLEARSDHLAINDL